MTGSRGDASEHYISCRHSGEEHCVVKMKDSKSPPLGTLALLLVYPRLQGPHSDVPLKAAGSLSCHVVAASVYKLSGAGTRDVFLFCNFCSFFVCFLFWLKYGLLLLALSSLCAVYTWLLTKEAAATSDLSFIASAH